MRTLVSAPTAYELKISLKHSHPLIWRRLLVPSDFTLAWFHYVIQTTMGWEDAHLHAFTAGKQQYGPPELEAAIDEEEVSLEEVLPKVGSKILYEYDFGDCWLHEIKRERPSQNATAIKFPVCLAGQQACPPEDSGGWNGGYSHMREVLLNPKHPEYNDISEWLGGSFNPDFFDLDAVNARLKKM